MIKALHLTSGIDIFGEVEETDTGYTVTNPSRVVPVEASKVDPEAPPGNIIAIPQPFAVHAAMKKIHVVKSAVVFVTEVHDYLIDFYRQVHSPIVMPPSASKIIPVIKG